MNSLRPEASAAASVKVFDTWWPLALSWLLMGIELPVLSAVVSRQANPEIMLAAFGGVIFPIALLVESPVIMMLAASTAVSRDLSSFRRLQRFNVLITAVLTGVHALIALTPLFDLVIVPLLDVPPELRDPSMTGLAIMIPWTWAIGDRRFCQGALIRIGHREKIAQGSILRLFATISAGLIVAWAGGSGVVIATTGLSVGVIVEAMFARFFAQRLVVPSLRQSGPAASPPPRNLAAFYLPLALTPMLILASQPLAAAGISRMPEALACLAVWGPAGGLVFLVRSSGIAFNEVVIARCEVAGAIGQLRRFAWAWGTGWTLLLLAVAVTPLVDVWFGPMIGLSPELVEIGRSALWLAIPIPLLTFLQSYWQGLLVHAHRTRAVTESVAIFLGVMAVGMAAGMAIGHWNGLIVAMAAFMAGNAAQTLWLRRKWLRPGPVRPEQPAQAGSAPEPI